MQLVTAVIPPHRLESVRAALVDLGVQGMTITEVRGPGRQGGHTEVYRGAEYQVDFVPKLKIEIVVGPELTDRVVDAVVDSARTGRIGDGKLWVTEVSRVIRVRTGERDAEAL